MSEPSEPFKKFAYLLKAMEKVRRAVETDRYRRPEVAHDVFVLMKRMREYCNCCSFVDFELLLEHFASWVNLTTAQLHYFADIGEWIQIDRETEKMSDVECDEYFDEPGNEPSMISFFLFMPQAHSSEDLQEIETLNALYHGSFPALETPTEPA